MTVSLVIPNWNGRSLIEKNISSWLAVGADEVIVVDDGSSDDSVEFIRNFQFPSASWRTNFQLIENKQNLGFARAVNRGVAVASGDIIILLNTDVKPEPGIIDAIMPHFKSKKVFGVSFNEGRWSWGKGKWLNGFFEHGPGSQIKETHTTFWISGGSGAFRKSIWDKLDGFSTIYKPFYWEDVDLSYRAAKRGYKLLWDPKAQVIHQHEGTIGKYFSKKYVSFIQERNQLLFIWKNITSPKMFHEHIAGLVGRIVKSPGYMRVVLAAIVKLPEIKKLRNKEIRESKITDEQIFAQFK